MRKRNFLIMLFPLFSSCIHLERSSNSGYAIKDNSELEKFYKSSHLNKILAELGLKIQDLELPENLSKVKKMVEIKNLESRITDEREKIQYFKSLPWLKNEAEQLDFLQQNGYFARQAWLRKNAVGKRATEINPLHEELIAAKDIAIGMPAELVRRSWGSPDNVDVAGNPLYGNERWRFKRYSPSPEGYRLQSKLVYFEGGKVVGWEQIEH